MRKNAENFLVAQFLTECECCEFAVFYKYGGDLQRLESLAFVTWQKSEQRLQVRHTRDEGGGREEGLAGQESVCDPHATNDQPLPKIVFTTSE